MPGILDGIRVIDLTVFQVGPFATAMLADLGADVIHVERLGGGDILRGLVSQGMDPMIQGRHMHFEEHNRNKRGIALDLQKQDGREALYRLVESADVFVTNLRPQAVRKLGAEYETLKRHNPRLIYAAATAFGKDGPDAELPSVDAIGLARGGLMFASGFDGDPPTPISVGTGDRATAFLLAYGVMGALFHRERTGVGQEVHTSMLGACIALHGWSVLPPLLKGRPYARPARAGRGYTCYQCADGRWVIVNLMREGHWSQLREALGDCWDDAEGRFSTPEQRRADPDGFREALAAAIHKRPAAEWKATVRDRAPDVLFSIVNRPEDLPQDEQATVNGYITQWDHPDWGPVRWVGFPVNWSATPAELRRPAPQYHEHTEEVLLEAGYDWDDIARLRDAQVI